MNRLYGVMNARLKDSDFLSGRYSIADIATYPWVKTINGLPDMVFLSAHPYVERWYKAIESREAVGRAYEKVDAVAV